MGRLAWVATIAALVGACAGTAGTLYVAERGPEGSQGEPGQRGPRGPQGPEAPEFDINSQTASNLDPEIIWQTIEDDPSRLGEVLESSDYSEPKAQSICDAMQLSSLRPLNDIGYSSC